MQMGPPLLIDQAQHHLALHLAHDVGAELLLAVVEVVAAGLADQLRQIGVRRGRLQALGIHAAGPQAGQLGPQGGTVPLLGMLRRAVGADGAAHRGVEVLQRLGPQVGAVEDLGPAPVDDLALLVHHLVVLEDVLAGLGVALLDGVLGPLDGLGDHAGLDGHVLGQGLVHHPVHGAGGEAAHQLVLQRQVEAALAGVALAPGAAPQLVVDAAALVALGAEHVQPAQLQHLLALGVGGGLVLGGELGEALRPLGVGLLKALGPQVAPGQALGVAAQQDVDAPPGHVGGHRHRAQPACLGDDLGLAVVLLGVEHLMGYALLVEQARQLLGLLHRHGSHQHRLAPPAALADVVGAGLELGVLGLVDEVGPVVADHRPVGGHAHHVQVVGGGELAGLGLGRAGHAGQAVVHPVVVLQGDGGQRLVLLLDGHPLLGLHGLVQPVGPAPPLQHPAGELVDDLHLAAVHDVVAVSPVQLLGPQRGLQLVHQVLGDQVVEVVDAEHPLDRVDAVLQRRHRALLLVDLVVDVALQAPGDGREADVELGRVGHLAADDQRGAGLVDEDRVDLVHDAVVVAPLDLLGPGHGHVVAQVVETELVVGAVGDVAGVLGPLELGAAVAGHDQPDAQAEPLVELAHPFGVASGQVVVDGDHVDALAGQAGEVDGQGGGEGLALAGAHLGHRAPVQRRAAH